jgi:D-lactate dehydrogenase (cytochrome)
VNAAPEEALLARLREIAGELGVLTDPATRALLSQDVYRSAELPLAVVRPATVTALAQAVAAITASGVAVFPRGGGMSYTDAFLPTTSRAIVIDTRCLARVVEINATDLHATVEAGISWAELDAALEPHGVRASFWGPMSGRLATVGGALSQGAVTFGSGRHGVSGQSVLGFEVVLADGRLLRTGSGGQPEHTPFFRHSGPDLTGLFAADNGALGVKATVTLALEPRPGAADGLSFAFDDFAQLQAAVGRIARTGVATEIFGAESALVRMIAGEADLQANLRTLLALTGARGSVLSGALQVLRSAAAGRRSLTRARYLLNVLSEASDRDALRLMLRDIRRIVGDVGLEIANTVPAITRATPFPDPMVLGPGGRRLLPLHGIFPPSAVNAFHDALMALRARWQPQLDTAGVLLPVVYASVGRNGFLYEPVIYWSDEWPALHREVMPAHVLAKMKPAAPNPAARALVEELRTTIIELMFEHGAAHLQIGRSYPYLRGRDAAFLGLLRSIKAELDPANLMNPGALGL